MKKSKYIIVVLFAIISCNIKPKQTLLGTEINYSPEYARGFSLHTKGDTTVLKITDPWQYASGTEFNYVLTPNASPKVMNEIKTPVTNAICMSTTHVALLSALEQTDVISGISGVENVSDSGVIALKNKIHEVGYGVNISYELIFSLQPDVIFAYGVMGEFAAVEEKLNELGIKVVYIGEYLEDSPLGKAEWLVAMSAFFNKQEFAIQKFKTIAENYSNAQSKLLETAHKPTIMLNVPYNDTWYLPGNKSYMTTFLRDAGAEYIYSEYDKKESFPMSIENAFVISQRADIWLISNAAKSLAELKNIDSRMSDIPAFRNKKVYNSNKRVNPAGGDDFWESGIIKPDIILKDMIKIFHPEIMPEHELYFYTQLQ